MQTPKYQDPPTIMSALDVWIASAYANRINGGYIKSWGKWHHDSGKPSNMSLVKAAIANNLKEVSNRDRDVGKMALEFFKREMLFKTLAGKISGEFEQKLAAACGMEEFAYSQDREYWSVIPSQIRNFSKARAYQDATEGVDFANQPIAEAKSRVTLSIKIIKEFYSQRWESHYYTGLTVDNQLVRFAFNKEKLRLGKEYKLKGTVIEFEDNTTKLNRVTFAR